MSMFLELDPKTIKLCASLAVWAVIGLYFWTMHRGPLSLGDDE